MTSKTLARAFSIAAVSLAALGIARLVDAVGKRELVRVAREVDDEMAGVEAEYGQLLTDQDHLLQDEQLLTQRLLFMDRREHYLVIMRDRRRIQLAMGDKVMLEVRYWLRGPTDGIDGFRSLPKAKLEVLGKRHKYDWSKPAWLFSLEGTVPPTDSADRLVPDAFGPGELFLGGGIAIHGRARGVPEEAIDHTYLQIDDKSLEAIVNAIEPGALVFIE